MLQTGNLAIPVVMYNIVKLLMKAFKSNKSDSKGSALQSVLKAAKEMCMAEPDCEIYLTAALKIILSFQLVGQMRCLPCITRSSADSKCFRHMWTRQAQLQKSSKKPEHKGVVPKAEVQQAAKDACKQIELCRGEESDMEKAFKVPNVREIKMLERSKSHATCPRLLQTTNYP